MWMADPAFSRFENATVFIGAESYAAPLAPLLAEAVLLQNAQNAGDPLATASITLGGVMFGDGLMERLYQYGLTMEFLKVRQAPAASKPPLCPATVTECGWSFSCPTSINDTSLALYVRRSECDRLHDSSCEEVAGPAGWWNAVCNPMRLGSKFDSMQCRTAFASVKYTFERTVVLNLLDSVAYLLTEDIPVLVYRGEQDAFLTPRDAKSWLAELSKTKWTGASGFSYSRLAQFTVDQAVKGSYRTYGGLVELEVSGSGHRVGKDQPAALQATFTKFVLDPKSFASDSYT